MRRLVACVLGAAIAASAYGQPTASLPRASQFGSKAWQAPVESTLPPSEAADEIADAYGWPSVICSQADVDASRCTVLQLGGRYTTVETKTNFANRKLGEMIRGYIVARRQRLAAASATTATVLPGAIE